MILSDVEVGQPHAAAHNDERHVLNKLIPTLEQYGGGVDVVDNAPAFAAAWADTDTIVLGQGIYRIASLVVTPRGNCNIWGRGNLGGSNTGGSVIQCTTANAGLQVKGNGASLRDLTIDGNSIATRALVSGVSVNEAGCGAGQSYENVLVWRAAGINWYIGGLQNTLFSNCQSSYAGGDNLVIDYGAGGLKFSRFESFAGGTSNLHIQETTPSNAASAYTIPTHINFDHCIFEGGLPAANNSVVKLNAGSFLSFDHCVFSTINATVTAPLVTVDGFCSTVRFDTPYYYAASTQAVFGGAGTYGHSIFIDGQMTCNTSKAVFDLTTNYYTVALFAQLTFQNSVPLKTAATPTAIFSRTEYTRRNWLLPAATDIEETVGVINEPAIRYARDASGSMFWGAGSTGGATDVTLARKAAGALGTSGQQVLATGSGTTAQRPAPAAALLGALYANSTTGMMEWCDGTAWRAGVADNYRLFTASGSFTVPANVTRLRSRVIGGGAGGGSGAVDGNNGASSAANAYGGVGGGSGAVNEQEITVTPGQVLTVTVGAGGAGAASVAAVAAGVTNGNAGLVGAIGGRSSLTGTGVNVRADGGDPGTPPTAPVGVTSGAAGVGGSMGGQSGNLQRTTISLPGNGSEYYNKPPLPVGVVGGNAGCYSVATNGGSGAPTPEWGISATMPVLSTANVNGSDAPSTPSPSGCGGSGGGAGAKGGSSGAGQPGGPGQVELWWVA